MSLIHPYSTILPIRNSNPFAINGSGQNFYPYAVSVIQPQRNYDIDTKLIEDLKNLEKTLNTKIDKLNKQITSNGVLYERRNQSL